MDWTPHSARLAAEVADSVSRWQFIVARTPRHELVPQWWENVDGGWVRRDGPSNLDAWMAAAYSDRSLVTSVGGKHADHVRTDEWITGRPTSSSTQPSLVVRFLRHARLDGGVDLLDLGTGSGGLAAYATRLLGDQRVTSLDVDPYLTEIAAERLGRLGLHPKFLAMDATQAISGTYDRIVSTVALDPGKPLVPVLKALRPGGRLVTTLANTSLILTAWKGGDGTARGLVERDWAGFMKVRHDADYPPLLEELLSRVGVEDGEEVGEGMYPVLDLANAWELRSMYELTTPGVELYFEQTEGRKTLYMLHGDGSWARATSVSGLGTEVHQSGNQRLWSQLERLRRRQNLEGGLPVLGSRLEIDPDGVCHLSRGKWSVAIG